MKKTIFVLILSIFAIMIFGMISIANAANESDAECKNLYWIDNDNKECGQKQFCGAYMYLGLQTFESKAACENALNNSKPECITDDDCPQPNCGAETNCIGMINKCIDGKCKLQNKTKACPENSLDENGKCMFTLSNGRKAEIKIMPDTASETAIAKLGELGFTIELKEVGKGKDAQLVYELKGNKQGKFLGIFKIIARVQAQVDVEDGKVKVIKPWWSFLASGI